MNPDNEELDLLTELLLNIDAIMNSDGKAAKKLRQINALRFNYHQHVERLKEKDDATA